jgi:hypothetical protein
MSDMKNLDDFIKTKLDKQTADVPAHIWDNIVDARKNKRPTGVWLSFLTDKNMLLLIAGLLVGGAGISVLNNFTNIASTKKTSATITTFKSNNLNKSGNSSVNQITYPATVSGNNSTPNSTIPDNNNLTTSLNTEEKRTVSGNNSSSTNTTVLANTASDNTKMPDPLNSKDEIFSANNVPVVSESNQEISKHKHSRIELESAKTNVSIIKGNSNTNVSLNNDLTGKNYTAINPFGLTVAHKNMRRHSSSIAGRSLKENTSISVLNETTDDNTLTDSDNSSAINNCRSNKIQFFKQGYLSNRLSDSAEKTTKPVIKITDNITANLHLPECPTVEKDIAGNKQYIEAYISPDYGIRTLTDTAKSNGALLQQRKQSTKFSTAFSVGIRYTKVFRSGISIAAGLNYSQINEKFTVAENIFLIETHYDSRGNVIGTDTVSGTQNKISHNHYHSVDVPLLFGYELGNDKIHVNINAGPVMNVYSWQHGEVLSADSLPVSISSGKSSSIAYQYKTNVGLGVTGGVSVFYKLNDQLHIYAEPYFRYNFSSMTNNQSPIQQKYTTVGMHIGLRLDL